MRSFRTSPWDPYENLPRDYARIFQFEDFKRTERAVLRRAAEEIGVVAVSVYTLFYRSSSLFVTLCGKPGVRVTIYLRDVPQEAATNALTVLFPLLQHEHKVSVMNFTVQRNTEYDGTVRSKACVSFSSALSSPLMTST